MSSEKSFLQEDLSSETLQKQFMITKSETNTSHVQEYGDMSIGEMTVAEFQGTQMANPVPPKPKDPCVRFIYYLSLTKKEYNMGEKKSCYTSSQDCNL